MAPRPEREGGGGGRFCSVEPTRVYKFCSLKENGTPKRPFQDVDVCF